MNDTHQDPAPDPRLADVLRSLGPEPPTAEVDWDALRASIRDRAALPLARRRRRWHRMTIHARRLVPAAAAAGIALWIGMRALSPSGPTPDSTEPAEAVVRPMVEDVLGAQIPEREFDLLFAEQVDAGMLVRAAVLR